MRRHEADPVSLVAGLLFLAVAVVHIAARSSDTDLSLRWMVPIVLVLLGVLGLLSAVRSPHSDRRPSADADASTTVERPGKRDETTEIDGPDKVGETTQDDETTKIEEPSDVTEVEPTAPDR